MTASTKGPKRGAEPSAMSHRAARRGESPRPRTAESCAPSARSPSATPTLPRPSPTRFERLRSTCCRGRGSPSVRPPMPRPMPPAQRREGDSAEVDAPQAAQVDPPETTDVDAPEAEPTERDAAQADATDGDAATDSADSTADAADPAAAGIAPAFTIWGSRDPPGNRPESATSGAAPPRCRRGTGCSGRPSSARTGGPPCTRRLPCRRAAGSG